MASPDFGPEQLARLMAMSRSKLYRLFESTGGVAHFINRERLHEAHRRLTHRDAPPIHVIGNEVGFADHSTFSRAFRREFGYSPTEARERSLARVSPARPEVAPRNGRGDGQSGSPDRVRDHVFQSGYSLMPQLVLERSVAAPSSASDGKRGAPKIGMTSAKLGF
jgi:AraC-like DNA-binding protein